jgi:hypothetical protein
VTVTDYFLGLDLGRPSDPTALAILKRSPLFPPEGGTVQLRDHHGDGVYRYDCLHLERFEPGTSYPSIVAAVAVRVADPRLRPPKPVPVAAWGDRQRLRPERPDPPVLAVDATGVGRAVVDLVLDAAMPAEVRPVTIVAGLDAVQEPWRGGRGFVSAISHRVPRIDLASTVQSCLQCGRLKVAPALPLAETLKKELLAFQLKPPVQHPDGAVTWRESPHDDLVLAVALAAWVGDHVDTPVYRFL